MVRSSGRPSGGCSWESAVASSRTLRCAGARSWPLARAWANSVVSARMAASATPGATVSAGVWSTGKGTPTSRSAQRPERAAAALTLTDGVVYVSAYTPAGKVAYRPGNADVRSARAHHWSPSSAVPQGNPDLRLATWWKPSEPRVAPGGSPQPPADPLKVAPISLIHSLLIGASGRAVRGTGFAASRVAMRNGRSDTRWQVPR